MKISKEEGFESVKISHFSVEDGTYQINDIDLGVQFGSSAFAVAAMLKGLEEYFLIPSGNSLPGEMKKAVSHNLEVFNKTLKPKIIES